MALINGDESDNVLRGTRRDDKSSAWATMTTCSAEAATTG